MRAKTRSLALALTLGVVMSLVTPTTAVAIDAAPARAAAGAPPYVACTAEQVRATQRWWFFGNRAVMDFGATGTTVTVSQNPASVDASEGTTVVSDTAGNLLFYSNGLTVWNRDHAVMQNGSGLTAAPSATQTVAAFPSLSRPGFYFVVSNGGASESGGVGPLRYSEVDLSLDGGLGAVTAVKNVLLDGGANSATEGMTAVPNADGTGFWVITATGGGETRNSDIVAHEFDGDGPTGTIVRSPMSTPNGNQFGTINLSQDMTKLVQHLGSSSGGAGQLRLLELDAATGEVTELVTWASPTGLGGSNAYSADFSPDGRWVYATRIFGTGQLFRYDIQTYTTASELQDNVEALGAIGVNGGQVKRAPDGRMYVANYGGATLGVINDPDNVSDPDYVAGSLALASGSVSRFGLPQTATGCPIPLTAPSGLSVTSAGFTAMDLTWSAPVDDGGQTLLGYRIERSLDGTTWATVVADTGDTGTTFHDTGLDAGVEYFYRVFAIFDSVTSDPSNVDSATTDSDAPVCADDNVDCFPSPVTGDDVILEVDAACAIQTSGVSTEAELISEDPQPFSYPLGLLDFELDCGAPGHTAQVTQYYFDTVDDSYILRKHHPMTGEYSTVIDAVIDETTLNGRAVLRVVYEIADGGPLDADGVVDGRISDPAGLAVSAVGAPRTGAGPAEGQPFFVAMLGLGLCAALGTVIAQRTLRRRPS